MPTSTSNQNQNQNQAQNLSFAQRTEQRLVEENQWQQYNSQTLFHPGNIQQSLQELAEKTFPTDTANCKAYEEAILKSLTETISPEIGIKDFWAKMAEAECKTLAIEEGHLNFYTSKQKRIDITPYTQAIVFEAHSSYYDQRQLERQNRIEDAQKQLKDLLEEINKNRKF